MALYRDHLLPRLLHAAMRQARFVPYRRSATAAATGRVLEIGVGSGVNLPFYTSQVTRVIGIDPSARLLAMARERRRSLPAHVTLLHTSAESIPLRAHSIDTIVMTWTLCSIPNPRLALAEMRRVIDPGGLLLFVEHGASPDPRVHWWQQRLTPVWKRIAGGCHLDRPVTALLKEAGFQLERLENSYMEGPRPMTYLYEGAARA